MRIADVLMLESIMPTGEKKQVVYVVSIKADGQGERMK